MDIYLQFHNQYLSLIKKIASSFPERHREDLVQEGLWGLYKACYAYDKEKNVPFDAFAKLCIKRNMITAYKKLKKDDDVVFLDESLQISDEKEPFEDIVIEKEYTDNFFEIVKKFLTSLEYNVLEHYLKGESYEIIASSLNLKLKAVDNTMARVKKKIKEKYIY